MRSLRDPCTNIVVALPADGLHGFASMKYADDEAHLLLLAVATAQRRKGLGSALLAWLEATLEVAGISGVTLETRAGSRVALAFYAAHGYREIERRRGYYEGIEDAVRLRRQLRA